MDARKFMAMALDPGAILRARGFTVDPWQRDVLLSKERQILLNCSRQAGTSTVVSALALHTALIVPKSTVLSPSPVPACAPAGCASAATAAEPAGRGRESGAGNVSSRV